MRRLSLLLLFVAQSATARVLMTQQQALAEAFPAGTFTRQAFFLTAPSFMA